MGGTSQAAQVGGRKQKITPPCSPIQRNSLPGSKKPPVETGGFYEMEREKRLERQEEFPHRNSSEHGCENTYSPNSQPASPELHPSKPDDSKSLGVTGKDMACHDAGATEFTPEVREIIESWLTLNPSIRDAIMTIVRGSQRVSASASRMPLPTIKPSQAHAEGQGISPR